MPCKTDLPLSSQYEWVEHMLCLACRNLTKDQMINIKGLDGYIGLLEWYRTHIMDDAGYFYRKINNINVQSQEHKDIGLDKIFSFEEERNLYYERQLQRCHDEAKRLGLRLIVNDKFVSLDND